MFSGRGSPGVDAGTDLAPDGDDEVVVPATAGMAGPAAPGDDAGPAVPEDEGDASAGTRVVHPAPAAGAKMLHVCVDVENTHPSPALTEMFEAAFQPFAVEKVLAGPLNTNNVQWIQEPCKSEKIQPSLEFGAAELWWKTMELTKTTRKDLDNCRKFPAVIADVEAAVEKARITNGCDCVTLSGWNFLATDRRLLVQLCRKHKRPWPATWLWGWDAHRAVFAKQGRRLKTKRASGDVPAQPAPAGNVGMSVRDVCELVVGQPLGGHHQAAEDVAATIATMRQDDVWKLRGQSLAKRNGWHLLGDKIPDHVKGLQESMAMLFPPLPSGWVDDPNDPVPTPRNNEASADAGPTTHASGLKARLACHWDPRHDREMISNVAKWTNFHAGEQAVKLGRGGGGTGMRAVFYKCGFNDPGARLRFRKRGVGESLVEMRKDCAENHAITGDHVDLALAVLARAGHLRHASLCQAWSTADGGSLRDELIANAITRDRFIAIWTRLAFMDCEKAACNEKGQVVSPDKCVRVVACLHAM